jgi:hypothetical protein
MSALGLTDAAWADICAAAEPHVPDAEARGLLAKALFEDYPGFTYNRERAKADIARAERMLAGLAVLEADHREQFPIEAWKPDQDYEVWRYFNSRKEVGLRCIEYLRGQAENVLVGLRVVQGANIARRNEQRASLYAWLCGIWLDHFGGALVYDRHGGEFFDKPGGPLVGFILAAMRQVMPKDALPSHEAIRDNIDRNRHEYEVARREGQRQRERAAGVCPVN